MGNRKNLSIKEIPNLFTDDSQVAEIDARLKIAVKDAKKLVKWRHRKYGHNDRAIIGGSETLPEIHPSTVDEAMYSIIAVVELAEYYLSIGPYSRRVIVAQAGELDLLWHLLRSQRSPVQIHERYPDWLGENKRDDIPPDGFAIAK